MQTIVEKQTSLSKYIVPNGTLVQIEDTRTLIGDMIVCDLNSSNAELFKDVIPPSNWEGNKYRYSDGKWTHYNNLGYLSVDDAKAALRADLEKLSDELLLTVMKCKLLLDPIPVELQAVIDSIPAMYATGKAEIEALTEEDYTEYVIRGPLVEQLFSTLKSYL